MTKLKIILLLWVESILYGLYDSTVTLVNGDKVKVLESGSIQFKNVFRLTKHASRNLYAILKQQLTDLQND